MSLGKAYAPIHAPTSDETQALVLAARWVAVCGTAFAEWRLNHSASNYRIGPLRTPYQDVETEAQVAHCLASRH